MLMIKKNPILDSQRDEEHPNFFITLPVYRNMGETKGIVA